jgi:hypothetical protein
MKCSTLKRIMDKVYYVDNTIFRNPSIMYGTPNRRCEFKINISTVPNLNMHNRTRAQERTIVCQDILGVAPMALSHQAVGQVRSINRAVCVSVLPHAVVVRHPTALEQHAFRKCLASFRCLKNQDLPSYAGFHINQCNSSTFSGNVHTYSLRSFAPLCRALHLRHPT